MLMLDAEVQRQWRKRGMRVTIIRIVINFPPEKAYNVALRIGDLKYCFQQGFKPRWPECWWQRWDSHQRWQEWRHHSRWSWRWCWQSALNFLKEYDLVFFISVSCSLLQSQVHFPNEIPKSQESKVPKASSSSAAFFLASSASFLFFCPTWSHICYCNTKLYPKLFSSSLPLYTRITFLQTLPGQVQSKFSGLQEAEQILLQYLAPP